MWIELLLVLIAVMPLIGRNKTRLTNDDNIPAALAGEPSTSPGANLSPAAPTTSLRPPMSATITSPPLIIFSITARPAVSSHCEGMTTTRNARTASSNGAPLKYPVKVIRS